MRLSSFVETREHTDRMLLFSFDLLDIIAVSSNGNGIADTADY